MVVAVAIRTASPNLSIA